MKFCENSTFFCIWIFYSRKNKRKVGFGSGKSSFSKDKYGNCWPKLFFWSAIKIHEIIRKHQFRREPIRLKSLAQTPRSLHCLGFVLYIYIFPMSDFLSKCLKGIFFLGNCCENRTKNKMFGEKCCENRTFWKKTFF